MTRFRPWSRRSDVLVVAVDLLCAAAVCWLAYRLRFEGDPVPGRYVARYEGITPGVCVAWAVAARASGLSRRAALRPGTRNLEQAFEGALVVGLAVVVVNYVGLSGDLSRAWIALVSFGLVLAGVGSRTVLRSARRALTPLGLGLERYAVVGEDDAAHRLLADLTRGPGAPFRVVGTVPAASDPDGLVQLARELRLDGLVLPPSHPRVGDLARAFSGTGIDVLEAPRLGELETRVASLAVLHGVPLLRVAGLSPRRRAVRVAPRDRLRHGVAILGTRGIPASYGGFETFAEELATRLAADGVPVTVYCRRAYATEGKQWRGVRLVTLPTIRSKHLDTVVHTTLSVLHLVLTGGPRDVVLCNAANAPVLPLLRGARRRVVLNVDGLEWRRSKWGVAGRAWYRMGEWLSVRAAAVLVTDAEEVRTYYRVRHDTESVMIPYGAEAIPRGLPLPGETPVTPGRYVLYVSRWEPENNPLLVAQAHAEADAGVGLVMLGSATYAQELEADVREAAAPSAVLPGSLFGAAYRGLQSNALCYVHATEVGGTHPALVEAMAAGNLCLVLDTPENREVATPAGAMFFRDRADLAGLIRQVAALDAGALDVCREQASAHAEGTYSWDAVVAAYRRVIAP